MTVTSCVKVVDASALAALLFQEPQAEAVAKRLQDASLTAPRLIDFELMNVCLNKIRRDRSKRSEYLEGFAARDKLELRRLDVAPDAVVELAETTGLTAYDASYLWLAQSQNAELVTLDKKLEAAFLQAR